MPPTAAWPTAPGASFTVQLAAGNISFGWHYDQGGGGDHTLLNGNVHDANGAYLAQIGLATTASTGPGAVAYLGLADNWYPGDRDFQDLTLSVTAVPEPARLALPGAGVLGMPLARKRRARLPPSRGSDVQPA